MLHILLIEDDFQLLRLCTRLLQNAGYDVYPAAAFPAAFEMFRRYQGFSLCISDITVGVYDPPTLIREMHRLRQQYKTPMMLMSAHMERYAPLCDHLALPYLAKPFFNQTFIQRVEELILRPNAYQQSS